LKFESECAGGAFSVIVLQLDLRVCFFSLLRAPFQEEQANLITFCEKCPLKKEGVSACAWDLTTLGCSERALRAGRAAESESPFVRASGLPFFGLEPRRRDGRTRERESGRMAKAEGGREGERRPRRCLHANPFTAALEHAPS